MSDPAVKRKIAIVAVDEAHCISEWGDDFRKSFRLLGGLRAHLDVPFMALTASAPTAVQSEVSSSLFMIDPVVVSGDLDRKNIFLSASPIKSVNVGFILMVILMVLVTTGRFVWCSKNFEDTCCCTNPQNYFIRTNQGHGI